MKQNQNNILFFRITVIFIGIIVLIGFLHLKRDADYDLISKVKAEQKELAKELSQKYNAAILTKKINQQKLLNKIIPTSGIVVADSVIKNFYQKGKDVYIMLKINAGTQNIYAKLQCSKLVIDKYFKLKSNKVFAVFKTRQILFNKPFYEAEREDETPLVLSGRKEILITGNCLDIVESPNCLVDG